MHAGSLTWFTGTHNGTEPLLMKMFANEKVTKSCITYYFVRFMCYVSKLQKALGNNEYHLKTV